MVVLLVVEVLYLHRPTMDIFVEQSIPKAAVGSGTVALEGMDRRSIVSRVVDTLVGWLRGKQNIFWTLQMQMMGDEGESGPN